MPARRKTIRVNDTPSRADARTERERRRSDSALEKGLRSVMGARADGWVNILTGLGDPRRDKRMAASMMVTRLTYDEIAALYRQDDVIAKIVDRPAMEMVREGFDVAVMDDGVQDEDTSDALTNKAEELKVQAAFYDAERYSRAYGGAGIFLGVVDRVGDARIPLDEERLEDVRFLTVLDCRELYPVTYYADPLSPNFGLPETYRVQPAFTPVTATPDRQKQLAMLRTLPMIHESRILRFPGTIVNRWQQRETLGWGDSVIQRVVDIVRDFQMSWHSASYIVQDFSQAVATMKGLSEQIENGDDKTVQARLLAIEMMRSVARMVVMEEGETFERKQTPVSGLDTLLDKFTTRVAMAADMPVTLLAGESPAGLNATGSADIRWFYDRIASMQRWRHLPHLRRLVQLICRSKAGPTGGKVPERIDIAFRPLWQLTSKEEADRRLVVAQTDRQYVDMQAVDPAEVALSRFGGAKYSADMKIDVEARRKFLEENPPGTERQLGLEGAAAAAEGGDEGGPGAGEPEDGEAPPAKGGKVPPTKGAKPPPAGGRA